LLYDDIDETPRGDVDYVRSQNIAAVTPIDTMTVRLSDVQDPHRSDVHIIKYTYRKDSNGGSQLSMTVTLLQGGTTIASWSHSNIGNTFTLAQQTLTATQADSITDYNDLSLQFTATRTGGQAAVRIAHVSWVEVQIG
jgi:hypothetical protein